MCEHGVLNLLCAVRARVSSECFKGTMNFTNMTWGFEHSGLLYGHNGLTYGFGSQSGACNVFVVHAAPFPVHDSMCATILDYAAPVFIQTLLCIIFLRGRGGVPSPSIHPFTHTHTRARAFNASDVPLPKLSCSRCELTECLTSRPHALHGPRLQLRLQVFLHDGKQLREVDRAFPAWGAERSLQQACLSCQAVPVTAAWWCYRGSTRARAHVCTV